MLNTIQREKKKNRSTPDNKKQYACTVEVAYNKAIQDEFPI